MKQRKLTLPKIFQISPWEDSKSNFYSQTITTIINGDQHYNKNCEYDDILNQLSDYPKKYQDKTMKMLLQKKLASKSIKKKVKIKKQLFEVPPQQIGKINPQLNILKKKFLEDCNNYTLLTWIREKIDQQYSAIHKQENRRKMQCLLPLLSPQKDRHSLKLEQYLKDNKKSVINQIRFLHI